MDYEKCNGLKDIHYMSKYQPNEMQYARYCEEPSIIATGQKLNDLYQAICRARAFLRYMCSGAWGDISDDNEINRLFAESQMATAAILEYSLCMDLCWQVIWAFFQPSSLSMLLAGEYQKMEKECTSEAVHEQLNCTISLHGSGGALAQAVKEALTAFENDSHIKEIRSRYNFMKHRGVPHFHGLGTNDPSLFYSVNGKNVPKLTRPSYTIDSIFDDLIEFDNKLVDFVELLNKYMIPTEYTNTSIGFGDFLSSAINIEKELP